MQFLSRWQCVAGKTISFWDKSQPSPTVLWPTHVLHDENSSLSALATRYYTSPVYRLCTLHHEGRKNDTAWTRNRVTRYDPIKRQNVNRARRTAFMRAEDGRGPDRRCVCTQSRLVDNSLDNKIYYIRELRSIFVLGISKYYTRTFKQIIFILFIFGAVGPQSIIRRRGIRFHGYSTTSKRSKRPTDTDDRTGVDV